MKTKKSAVDLTDLAIGIIVLGIVVSIGSVILINIRDNTLTDLPLITTVNETIAATDGGTNLANTWVQSISVVSNSTTQQVIEETGNFSLSISDVDGAGTVTWVGSSDWNGTNVNVTYDTYDTSQADWDVANAAASGLAEYGNWFDIIVIVGVAAVVLSLIFMAFGRRSESAGQSY